MAFAINDTRQSPCNVKNVMYKKAPEEKQKLVVAIRFGNCCTKSLTKKLFLS